MTTRVIYDEFKCLPDGNNLTLHVKDDSVRTYVPVEMGLIFTPLSPEAGYVNLYADTTSNRLKIKNSAGDTHDVTSDATYETLGIVKLANSSEVSVGTDATRAVTCISLGPKGGINGFAELDGTGKVPEIQLPDSINNHTIDASIHRTIDDNGVSATDLWSADKINSEISLKESLSNKNAPNGYLGLDSNGLVMNEHIPPLAITKPLVYQNNAERDADEINIQMGDVAIILSDQKSYIYSGDGFVELVTTGSILAVNGLSGGAIQLDTSHIPESGNLYFTQSRVSANTNLVGNTTRIVDLETWYEVSSSEECNEVFNVDSVIEMSSVSHGTSFTPSAGTYRATFNAQFQVTKGGTIASRCPDAILYLIEQLDALVYTTHAVGFGVGEVLTPGNYYAAGASTHGGALEFDANNDPNATFVISCGAAHDVQIGASYILSNGAKSCNIIYHIVGALSIADNITIPGTYACNAAIGIGINCILDGRLFTTLGAITTGNVMGLPVGDTFAFDLGVASQFVLFSSSGNITNSLPASNPSVINSGLVACGTGNVLEFPPYDGSYVISNLGAYTFRIVFGIYNGAVLSPSSLTYMETSEKGDYFNISIATTIVNNGVDSISARVGVDSVEGSVIIKNRTLFARRL
jgi:hypothetical protein